MATERYNARPIGANGTLTVGVAISGFLCTVAGTITIKDAEQNVLVNAMPVATGFNRIPIIMPTTAGGSVTLGGGAAGTLLT